MFLKQEFWHTAEKMGLEDTDIDLAAIIWQKCELAMQGKTQQTPALLQQPEAKWTAMDTAKDDLSQADIQRLISLLQRDLNWYHADIMRCKRYIAMYYAKCNPEDKSEEMQCIFKYLNWERSDLRQMKERYSKLSNLQKTLKKMRKG